MKVESKANYYKERLVTDRNLVHLGNLPPKYISPVDKPVLYCSVSHLAISLGLRAYGVLEPHG